MEERKERKKGSVVRTKKGNPKNNGGGISREDKRERDNETRNVENL